MVLYVTGPAFLLDGLDVVSLLPPHGQWKERPTVFVKLILLLDLLKAFLTSTPRHLLGIRIGQLSEEPLLFLFAYLLEVVRRPLAESSVKLSDPLFAHIALPGRLRLALQTALLKARLVAAGTPEDHRV